MSIVKVQNNEIENNEMKPFNKELLTNMVINKQLDEAKEYVKQYIFKTYKLFYLFDPDSNTLESFERHEIKTFLSKNIKYKERDNEDDKAKEKSFSDWFLDLECTFYKLAYDLSQPFTFKKKNTQYLNLFRGFKFNNLTIQDETNEYLEEGVKYIFNHMDEVICSGDKPAYGYLKKWIAKLVYCKAKMKTCVYLKGTQGAGKSSLSNFLLEMIGTWNAHKTQSVKCLISFNGELIGKSLLILEEMKCESYGEWVKMNSSLNAFITEDIISLEDKGKTMVQVNNNLSIIITSNDSPIKMNEKDRRYFLSDVSNHRDGDKEYFNKLYEYMQNESIQKAFYFECKRIMDENQKFNELTELKDITTSAKCEVIIKNLHPLYRFIREKYYLKKRDFNIFLKDLTSDFNLNSEMKNDLNSIEISRMLKDIHINGETSTGNRLRYKLPYCDLYNIFQKLHWTHQDDEFEDGNKQDKILNIVDYKSENEQLKEENNRLKEENELFKKLLNEKKQLYCCEFIHREEQKTKEKLETIEKSREILSRELIKTITPENSPKKTAPLFPRPLKKEVVNKHDITDQFDNDVISKIFLG